MAFLDTLVGGRGVRRQRRLADQFVEKMYDSDVYNPMADEAAYAATEGIPDEQIRKQLINQIYRSDVDNLSGAFGGNAAGLVAAMGEQTEQKADAMSQAELGLSLQDEQAKLEGRQKFAEVSTQQQQIRAQRQAKLEENKLLMETELENRKRRLIGGIASTAIMAGFTALTGGFGGLALGAAGAGAAKNAVSGIGGTSGQALANMTGVQGLQPVNTTLPFLNQKTPTGIGFENTSGQAFNSLMGGVSF